VSLPHQRVEDTEPLLPAAPEPADSVEVAPASAAQALPL
jgi:hypothetical protein